MLTLAQAALAVAVFGAGVIALAIVAHVALRAMGDL